MGRSDPVEVEGVVKAVTKLAVLIDCGGDEEVWIPRSQILEIPEWLAEEKGLI